MSQTIFFRFPDRATFEALLPSGFKYMGETVNPMPDGLRAISIIGDVNGLFHVNALASVETEQTTTAPDGTQSVEMVPVVPQAFTPYRVNPYPLTPWRVFG